MKSRLWSFALQWIQHHYGSAEFPDQEARSLLRSFIFGASDFQPNQLGLAEENLKRFLAEWSRDSAGRLNAFSFSRVKDWLCPLFPFC